MSRITRIARYSASSRPSAAVTCCCVPSARHSSAPGSVRRPRDRPGRRLVRPPWVPLPLGASSEMSSSGRPCAAGQVHRDAEQPGVRLRVAAEAVEIHQCPGERFLRQLACFVVIADHSQDRVVQSILVADDDLPERRSIARSRRLHQSRVGRRGRLCFADRQSISPEMDSAQARHRVGRTRRRKVPWRDGHPCPYLSEVIAPSRVMFKTQRAVDAGISLRILGLTLQASLCIRFARHGIPDTPRLHSTARSAAASCPA